MSVIKKIAVSNGGGDCPGLNAVIRAVVRSAINKYNWEVIGIEDGFDGLLSPEKKSRPLRDGDVSGIISRGGTILGTTNRGNPFKYHFIEDGREVLRDVSGTIIENAKKLGIDALINIGGDGTQKIGLELFRKGLNLVGVPKTIDNDLSATDQTFGFDTALYTATESIDKIHTTADAHHRVMVVEVMGRDAGWIALEAGIAGAAQCILIPEIPFTIENVCELIQKRVLVSKRYSIVVVAEGIEPPAELIALYKKKGRTFPTWGSAGTWVGDAIAWLTGRETRVAVLGHIQRGGSPSPFDRILSTRFGVAAVDLIAEGRFGRMVCLHGNSVGSATLEEAVGKMKMVDPNGELVRTAKAIGIGFGD